ncbi:MAG: PilZ domain-containing protein [Sphingomonas sp.]|uniref:PilZ domain-containing protein n=1 Tax=Sphingomonas sp. TaxID=28214 RepID=UPI001B044988|nr:PilZ domain-containing protein [Sphingomonas sp.]MBO9622871.1 PilZ domain-containing protein [Sphingomonas sp.]
MGFGRENLAFSDPRRVEREDVHYRARAQAADGKPLALLIVNISPHGLMARCDQELQAGDRIRVTLPAVGTIAAEVRWSLGGRLGCEFEKLVELAAYYDLLAALVRNK